MYFDSYVREDHKVTYMNPWVKERNNIKKYKKN